MIVYGEMLVIENVITGSVLLYITGEICGVGFGNAYKIMRFAVGSILCGLFSMVLFCQLKMPFNILAEVIFALTVCLVVFGKKGVYKKAAVFVLLTYFMGGITMGLLLATGNTGIYAASGVYTGNMKAAVLALFTASFFAASKQVIRVVNNLKLYSEHRFDAVIASGGKMIKVLAFLDTGNSLKDPVTGRPVAVAEDKLWKSMEEEGLIEDERFCVIPYRTVGSKGVMRAVRVDYISIGGKCIRNCIIARNDQGFDIALPGNEDCVLLLSKYMAQRRM